ncbi:MAG: VCBS repeat-containing protein [Myxococcales bacterium]|nr:VCBS repeat-containing protein [Myxococcales bacterium]
MSSTHRPSSPRSSPGSAPRRPPPLHRSHPAGWLATLAGVAIAVAPLARAAPRDPFARALPTSDTQAVERRAGGVGSVAATQGSASYSYAIEVPPGRRGMAPALALGYASTAPLRGGLAAGWSLDLPVIERDPEAPAEVRYRLTMPGTSGVLVPVTGDPGSGTRYRVELDEQFARVERTATSWVVSTPDGRMRIFDVSGSDGATRWDLTAEQDAFGNRISYVWASVGVNGYTERVLQRVEYGWNSAAGLGNHAKIELTWNASTYCANGAVPIGAQTDHHFGARRMRGARALAAVRTYVRDTPGGAWRANPVREVTLTYDTTACDSGPPLRYLARIDSRAWSPTGQVTSAPPVRFGYGAHLSSYADTRLLPGRLEVGTSAGPETRRLDFDGDGVLDVLRVVMPAAGERRCRLVWQKGVFGGGVRMEAETLELPTAAWWFGAPTEDDACTIDGQFASHGLDVFHADGALCAKERGVEVGYHWRDWDGDGDTDLITATWRTGTATACGPDFVGTCAIAATNTGGTKPCGSGDTPDSGGACHCDADQVYDPTHGECHPRCASNQEWNGGTCVDSCDSFDACTGSGAPGVDLDDPPPLPEACGPADTGIEHDAGTPVWRVFVNDPNRGWAPRIDPVGGLVFHSPVALPQAGGVLAPPMTGVARLPRLADLDGDGRQDLIELVNEANVNLGTATGIKVYRGLADDTFAATPTVFAKPTWYFQQRDTSPDPTQGAPLYFMGAVELADWNGDGLPDLVTWVGQTPALHVSYNLGDSFGPLTAIGLSGPVSQARTELDGTWLPNLPLTAGWRADERRLVDVDGDGLLEVVQLEASGSVANAATNRFIYRFHGDRLAGPASAAPASFEPFERLVHALNRKAWYRASDVVDVTSDGVPDLVTATTAGLLTVRTDAGAPPLRLLTSIDNGRGAVTTFEYAHAADPSVVTIGAGDGPPSSWVVRRVRVAPGGNQPELTTRYAYAEPVRGHRSPRDLGPPTFLGFATVTTYRAGQPGADSLRTTSRYDYAVGGDGRGHLAQETIDAAGADGVIAPVSETTYHLVNKPMLGGAVSATFTDQVVRRTLGATPTAHRTTQIYTPYTWSATGKVLHYEATQTLEDEGSPWPGRAVVRSFQRRLGQAPYAASDYRVLQVMEDRQLRYGTYGFSLGSTYTYFDTPGLPYRTEVSTGTNTAATVRAFDATTGLLATEKRPRQVEAGASGKVATFTYDAHKLFVARGVNELGHTVDTVTDVGTGVTTRTLGPNARYLPPPGCAFPCLALPLTSRQIEEWTIDGFGRVTEHRVPIDAADGGYALAAAARTIYQDLATPNRRIDMTLRELGGAVWITTSETTDGLGRTLTRTAYHQQSGKPDRVTTYAYDAGGELREVRSPDPRETTGYNAGAVSDLYLRDGLGRVVRHTRPDGSGTLASHRGGETVSTPLAADGTLGAATTTIVDGHGRLRFVKEHDNPVAGATAVTEYGYDEADRMTSIRDADGVVTSIGYDHRGLRTGITRGSRTWSYTYDLDGNLISETTPKPAGASGTTYTSTTTYDELGRVKTYTPATRGMDAARMSQLGVGPITTSYDSAANGVGLPAQVTQSGLFTVAYTYDVRQRLRREQRTVTLGTAHGLTAPLTASLAVDRTYDLTGAPLEVSWGSGARWRYAYDALGQPTSVAWRDPATGQDQTLAAYTRTVAGAPRLRTSSWDQRRTWTYDVLGRVDDDRIHDAAGTRTWAERRYGYDALGTLGAVTGTVDGRAADAVFEHDPRGRVISAEGPDAYTAALTYTGAGNIDTATVSGALDAPARAVRYRYGAHDPQAVDRLDDLVTGAPVAEMSYDPTGNVVTRSGIIGATALTWGGDNQLREVIDGGARERYVYAGGGQRLAAIGPDGVRLWFGELEQRYTLGGVLQTSWHHVAMGEPIARLEVSGGATTIELQYADALQNLMLATSTGGVVRAAFLHGAFGEVVAATGGATHPRHFNGKDADPTTGLRYYGYRYYDPATLRWTAADPLYRFAPDAAWSEPQRANLYAFSLNDPLTYIDPDGRDGKKRRHDDDKDDDDPLNQGPDVTAGVTIAEGELVDHGLGDNATILGYEVKWENGNIAGEVVGARVGTGEIPVTRGVTTETEAEVATASASAGKDGVEVAASLAKATQSIHINLGPYTLHLEGGLNFGVGAKFKDDGVKMAALVELGATLSPNKRLTSGVDAAVKREGQTRAVRAAVPVLLGPWAPMLVAP